MTKLKSATVLLTGGRGFLGTFVRAMLEQKGAKVYSVSRRDGYDLRNESEALSAMLLTKPTAVIHLAAQQGALRTGGALFKDNLQMGINVIHAATLSKAPVVVMSDRWFGAEDAPVGSAKQTLHQMCVFYRKQYGLKAVTLIAPDLYGVGGAPFGVVHRLAMQLCEAKVPGQKGITVPWAPDQKVSLLHAFDAASAIVKACEDEVDDHAPLWLTPPDQTLDYEGLLKKLTEATGYTGEVKWEKRYDPATKQNGVDAVKVLKWHPQVSIAEGIAEEMSWFAPKTQEAKA